MTKILLHPLPGRRQLPNAEQLALWALCLLAFAWRVAWLDSQSLWRDEVDSIRFAGRALPELLALFAKPGENGPLYFLLLRPWLELSGSSEFALRMPSALAGMLAVPLTFATARRLASVCRVRTPSTPALSLINVPLIAALLVAANPFLVWYSQEGKMYAILVDLVLAANLAFLSALMSATGWRWMVYLVLICLACLTHILAVLMLLVHVMWLLLLGRGYRRSWLPFMAVLLLLAVPYFRLAGWWQLRLFASPEFQTGHAFVSLPVIGQTLLAALSRGVAYPIPAWATTPLIFLLLTGLTLGGKAYLGHEDGSASPFQWPYMRPIFMTVAWLLVPPLALYVITLVKPLYTDRYVLWAAPAFALMTAYGIAALSTIARPASWLALVSVLAVCLGAGWWQAHTPVKSDFRRATAYVEQHRRPGDRLLFQIPYGRHPYEYYAGPLFHWIDGPYTNGGSTTQQVAAQMTRLVADAPAVWLVLTEESLWDQRGQVRDWLDSYGSQTDHQSYTRVQVIRYDLPPAPP